MVANATPNWLLLQECARKLTAEGRTPFTRQDLIACVKQTHPEANPDSLGPMIQAITVNAKGGVRAATGRRRLTAPAPSAETCFMPTPQAVPSQRLRGAA